MIRRQYLVKDNVFYMSSELEGEFGIVSLMTSAPLYVENEPGSNSISQVFTLGNPADLSFDMRISEMSAFLQTFTLFNPNPNEKKSSSSEPSDLPF